MTLPKSYLLAIALGTGVASCSLDRDGRTLVEGQVVDSQTKRAIGPAQVQVMQNQLGGQSAAYTPVGNWRDTDADGRFEFTFDADGERSYILMARSARGNSQYLTSPPLTGGRKNKRVRVPVVAPAWLRVRLLDEPPRTDALAIAVGGFVGSVVLRTQDAQDTAFVRLTTANDPNVVVWRLQGGRTASQAEQRLPYTAAPLDTALLVVRY